MSPRTGRAQRIHIQKKHRSKNMDNTNEVKFPDLTNASSREAAEEMVKILDMRKAKDIKLLRVEEQTIIAEYFVICSGSSSTQIKSMAGELEYKMSMSGVPPYGMDGYTEGKWIVIDFGSVMVHIFGNESRDFYKLEKFWADSEEIDISSLLTE
jgi:ribosome-associated protein